MKIKEHLGKIPNWMRPVIAVIVAFIMVYVTQSIFVRPVFHAASALDYWNLRWMRGSEYLPPEFFGYRIDNWFWIDTFIFFMATFISTIIASFVISLTIKEIWKALVISLTISSAAVIQTLFVFIQTGENGQLPLHVLACFTGYKYELAQWTLISAIAGVLFFFLIKRARLRRRMPMKLKKTRSKQRNKSGDSSSNIDSAQQTHEDAFLRDYREVE